MDKLGADPDPPVWTCQTHRVPLHRARHPQVGAELKHEVGMGFVRLGGRHLPIVDRSGETFPGVFADDAPLAEHSSLRRDFHDHVEAGIDDEYGSIP